MTQPNLSLNIHKVIILILIHIIQGNNLPILDMFINPVKKPMLKAKENAMKKLIQNYISNEMNVDIFNKVMIIVTIGSVREDAI